MFSETPIIIYLPKVVGKNMSTSCFPVKLFYFPLPAKQITDFSIHCENSRFIQSTRSLLEISPMQQIWKKLSHSIHPPNILLRCNFCTGLWQKQILVLFQGNTTSVYRNVSFPFLLEKQGKGNSIAPLKWALLVEKEYIQLHTLYVQSPLD